MIEIANIPFNLLFILEIRGHRKHRLDVRSTWDRTRHPITWPIEANGWACMKSYTKWPVCVCWLCCFMGLFNTLANSVLHSCVLFLMLCNSPVFGSLRYSKELTYMH